MNEIEILAAIGTTFVFGLTSSFHCVVMCGPLIATARSLDESKLSAYLYQFGRLLSYAVVGAVLGFLGNGANALGELKQIQGLSAILSLSLMLLVGLSLVLNGKVLKIAPSFSKFLTPIFKYFKNKNQTWALGFSLGLLSAFLPCGVLYPAYAVSFATGNFYFGTLVMVGFFLGTFPTLFGFSLGINWIRNKIQPKFVSLFGIFLIILSLAFLMARIFSPVHSEHCEQEEKQI